MSDMKRQKWIRTGTLAAADLVPQVYLGKLHEGRDIEEPEIVPMENQGATTGDGASCRAMWTSAIPTRPASSPGHRQTAPRRPIATRSPAESSGASPLRNDAP